MTNHVKRFIAGAVCPQCALEDKLVVYKIEDTEYCECVRCGFTQQQEAEPQPVVAKIGKKEQVIRIIKPKKEIA